MVTEGGLSIPEVGRERLSIPKSTLAYWVKIAKEGRFSDTGKKQKHITGEQMELARLEIEIRAAHKDLFNGEMVGYALGSRITKDLVVRSLLMAVKIKQPQGGLIHHFDRGSQYCSHDYVKLLGRFNMRVSMSRKGN